MITAAHSRRLAALPVVVRFLCEHLVRRLLIGAFNHVLLREGAAQDRAFSRFVRLVNAAPCWPFYVEFMHPREMKARAMAGLVCWPCLVITTEPPLED